MRLDQPRYESYLRPSSYDPFLSYLSKKEEEAAYALCSMAAITLREVQAWKRALPEEDHHEPSRTISDWLDTISPPMPAKLYPTSHQVRKGKYAVGASHLSVYEYDMHGQVMMIETDTSLVRFTSIWKALGNAKADVARLQEMTPQLTPHIRKIRGGFLKVQGTWLPFDIAKELARRVAYEIRFDLIPIFGPRFADSCLKPGDEDYGHLALGPMGRRGRKRTSADGRHQTSRLGPATRVIVENGRIVELKDGQDSKPSRYQIMLR